MDKDALIEFLNSEINQDDAGYSDSVVELLNNEDEVKFGDYTLKTEERYGGEGQGDQYWLVFSANKKGEPTTYYKIPGWYASHYGHEWSIDRTFEVKPTEVTVIEWKKA